MQKQFFIQNTNFLALRNIKKRRRKLLYSVAITFLDPAEEKIWNHSILSKILWNRSKINTCIKINLIISLKLLV